ncbi:cytochrome b [Microcoleus sp. OTE_8_concoct_300]|uniref:cytochrome b n=1 Tax=Microcoleus sp. OTE_8_concoct_300 TaxID=2964710 RepID=UPI00403F442A
MITQPAAKPRLNSAFKQLMSLHWAMAACYLVLFITGPFMSELPREFFIRNPLYAFHKSVGVLTMAFLTLRILTLLRVWWKKYTKRLPKFTKEWYKNFALHATLYVFMWLVPVAGFLLSNSIRNKNVPFFGIVVPDMFPKNPAMVEVGRSLHFWLSYTFLAFVILHLLDQKKVVRANWRRLTNFVGTKFPKSQKVG